jgi:circadian clock protein KaiB
MTTRPRIIKKRQCELELFVSGLTTQSIRTVERIRELCEVNMPDAYSLKIIDIYKEPKLAKENDVFAVPALIIKYPGRRRVFIGDLSDVRRLSLALGIRRKVEGNDN